MLRERFKPGAPFDELRLVVETATSLMVGGKSIFMEEAVKDAARIMLMAQDLMMKVERDASENQDSRQPAQDQGEQETRD